MKKILFFLLLLFSLNAYTQVGIGTTTPDATLTIEDTDEATMTLRTTGGNGSSTFNIESTNNTGATGSIYFRTPTLTYGAMTGDAGGITFESRKDLFIYTMNGPSVGSSMVFKQDGTIGINTNNPSASFDITGNCGGFVRLMQPVGTSPGTDDYDFIYMKSKDNGAFYGDAEFYMNPEEGANLGAGNARFQIHPTSIHFGIFNSNGGDFTILPSGNIGINTGLTGPTNKLHIVSSSDPLRLEGLQASSKDTILVVSGNGVVSKRAGFGLSGWQLSGNSGTTAGTNFIGTTDAKDLVLKVNNQQTAKFSFNGNTLFLGYQAGLNSTGVCNVGIGYRALYSNTTGGSNTVVGYNSASATTGASNTVFGSTSLKNNTTAGNNIAIGVNALYNQSFSNGGSAYVTGNVAVGDNSLFSNQPTAITNGIQNTAIGFTSLYMNTIGRNNTAVGNAAMFNNITGINNTALGMNSFIGSGTDYVNSTAIGYEAPVNASNQVRLGNENITSLVCTGAYSASTTESPNVYVDNTGQIMRSTTNEFARFTQAGGVSVAMTNASGSPLLKGTLLMASSTSNGFTVASTDCEFVIGVLAQDCAAGAQGWVIVSGIAEVLVKDGISAVAGNWSGASDNAGRAYFVAGAPGTTQHDREIGHCIQSVASGTNVLAKVVLHFR